MQLLQSPALPPSLRGQQLLSTEDPGCECGGETWCPHTLGDWETGHKSELATDYFRCGNHRSSKPLSQQREGMTEGEACRGRQVHVRVSGIYPSGSLSHKP